MAEKRSEERDLTLKEAAKILKRSPRTIRRWIAAKRLSAHMIGGRYSISEHDLKRLTELDLEQYGITEREVERCQDYFTVIGGRWEGKIDALMTQLMENGIHPNAYIILRDRGWLHAIWKGDHEWLITLQDE